MRVSKMVLILVTGLLGGASAWMAGCGGDDTQTTPTAACALTDPACLAVKSDCIALVDNAGQQKIGLRIAQLTITTPAVLATGVVANLVSNGVTMTLEECRQTGTGTFNWLFELTLDATGESATARTGGAKPAMDPRDGYCFVNETITQNGTNFMIAPVTYPDPITVTNGAFVADKGMDLIVPIYLDATDLTQLVLLPLHKARIKDGTISPDRNCIGKYNAEGLEPVNNCLPDSTEGIHAFVNGAKLDGFLTLEEADNVVVDIAATTLCAILTGGEAMYIDSSVAPSRCARDPVTMEILYKGDWCSTTDAAADTTCSDSVRLGAEFAANAVKINGDCPAP
jgi:hypothetical protein